MNSLSEKYNELKTKSIKDALLEDIEKVLSNWKSHVEEISLPHKSYDEMTDNERRFEYTIIWQPNNSFLDPWHHGLNKWDYYACAGQGYKQEIDEILKKEGFKCIEDYGSFNYKPRTTYVFK